MTLLVYMSEIMDIKDAWLNFWIHICMQVNCESGDLNISVNGILPTSTNIEQLSIQKPNALKDKLFLHYFGPRKVK